MQELLTEDNTLNNVYFACRTCKTYQDAGYRWCYWTLEHPGIVERGKSFVVSAVLSAPEYWQGGQDASWLQQLLPKVRAFLERHRTHELVYGDDEDIGLLPTSEDDYRFLDWLNEDDDDAEDLLPRYFIERLGYNDWQQVTEHIAQLEHKPVWWYVSELRDKAKEKFISLLVP